MGVMGARRLMSVVVVSSCVLACVLYCGASAFAARGHVFSASFGAPGSGDGQLDEPSGVAVNESTGDVYVVDKGNGRVEEFSATGTYIGQFNGSGTLAGEGSAAPTGQFVDPEAIAVDNSGDSLTDPSAGDVYVVDQGHKVVDKFSAAGAYIGQLTETAPGSPLEHLDGIAVDQNGTLWVDNIFSVGSTSATIDSFSDAIANEFLSETHATVGGEPGFAVDSEGNLYVGFNGLENTHVAAKLNSGGSVVKLEVDERESTVAFAVDLSNNDLYIDNIGYISLFSPESDLIERFGSGLLKSSAGVAVDSSTGMVYVTDAGLDVVDGFEIEPFSPPVVEDEWVADVSSTSATLDAQINPRGSSTEYVFEYGPTASYGTSVPVPDGSIASGFGGNVVGAIHRAEFLPDTTYHYRVVAHNELGTVDGPDRTFTTQPAGEELALPDGRAWELVSPPDKKGAVIEPFNDFSDVIQAADDGDGITYPTEGPAVGENPGSRSVESVVLSRRGAEGWGSADIDMPRRNVKEGESAFGLPLGTAGEYGLFSPDLSLAVAEPSALATPPLSPEATERTLYVRDNENASFQPMVTPADVPPGTKFGGEESVIVPSGNLYMRFITATPDLSHVVFESPLVLTPGATFSSLSVCGNDDCGAQNLYEWSAGRLQLVSILPDGKSTNAEKEPHEGGFVAGEGQSSFGLAAHPVSTDGRWIVWTWGNPYRGGPGYGGLYVRDMVDEKTVQVGGGTAEYQAMSSDGSRLFYLEDGDLYEFDTATDTETDLTAKHAGEVNAGVQQSVSDVSEDGSYVYFVATGVLAQGGVSGEDNLYLLHDTGSERTTTYIATLSHEDEKSWHDKDRPGEPPLLPGISSRVSPDGRYLAFMSDRSLTGYDNLDANNGQPDEEVYLYDSATSRLVCASCNPTGARPVGVLDAGRKRLLVDNNEYWGYKTESGDHWLAASIPGWTYRGNHQGLYQPRYLSDNGRLFFNSADALAPQDSNGLEDVYEYEPPSGPGAASSDDCAISSPTYSGRSDGCIDLISSGTSGSESVFYDASENGDDVFFLTASSLTAADYDDTYDVYDAHVCSSAVPCRAEPVSSPPCTSGDSCKAAPSPQPEIFGPAPSATFSGAGNVIEEAKKTVAKGKPKAKHKKQVKHKKRKAKKAKKAKRARAGRKGGKR